MFVGYMRVSSDSDRQSTNLQRDALLAAAAIILGAGGMILEQVALVDTGPDLRTGVRTRGRRAGRLEAGSARPLAVALVDDHQLATRAQGRVSFVDRGDGHYHGFGRTAVPCVRRACAV